MPVIRLALLDDHPAIRTGLSAIIAKQPDLRLVGSAADEPELWPLLQRTYPAVLILDYHHPGRDGLALCLQAKLGPEPPAVILYSAYAPDALMAAAAVAGADALVSKSTPVTALLAAIRTVARTPREILPITPRMKREAAAMLDPADHAILAMRVAGNSPAEIAATLGLSEGAIAGRIGAVAAQLAQHSAPPADPMLVTSAA